MTTVVAKLSAMRSRMRRAMRHTRAVMRSAAVFAHPSAMRGIEPRAWYKAARVLRTTGIGPHTAAGLYAVLRADRAAIADDTRSLTWHAFDREIGALARGLGELGVKPGDRVAIVLPSSIEHVVAQQAIMRAA